MRITISAKLESMRKSVLEVRLTISAYLVLLVPPSERMNEVSPSLAPGGLLRSLTGDVLKSRF